MEGGHQRLIRAGLVGRPRRLGAVLAALGSASIAGVGAGCGAGAAAGGNGTGGAGPAGGAIATGGSAAGGSTSTSTGGAGAAGGAVATVGGLFTEPEPWTKDVSGLAADPSSTAIVGALKALGGWGGGKVQVDFSIPLFFADGSTPRQTITAPAGGYCYGGTDCDPVPLTMPLPAEGNAEGSANYTCDTSYATDGQGDCHVLVADTGAQKLYELYNATAMPGGAFTALGAFVWDLAKAYPDNLRGDQCTSADAAGFPIAALLPTADEVASGTVAHALRFILPNERMKKAVYVHPATHAGSPSSTNANAPPYGVRFRLKAVFDETPYDTGERTILHALKTYGMLLSDGGNIALTFADDRTTTATWASVGITAQSFAALAVDDFEVVDLSAAIALTDDCARNP